MQREEFEQYFGTKDGDSQATTMTTTLSNGDVIDLVPDGSTISLTFEKRNEFVSRVKQCRLNEGAEQVCFLSGEYFLGCQHSFF